MNAWSADSTTRYYARLLAALKPHFTACRLREAADRLSGPDSLVFLRHDIDISLRPVLRIAEIEHEAGVPATYMIPSRPTMYSLKDSANRATVRRLVELGHEVGVHIDCLRDVPGSPTDMQIMEEAIPAACGPIDDILGVEVKSVSFHRPASWLLRGPMHLAGRVNAYAAELMVWYLSDSKGSWREGEPLPMIERPRARVLQLLTHPIWWGEDHQEGPDRLERFVRQETAGRTPEEAIEFRRLLAEMLPGVNLRTHR